MVRPTLERDRGLNDDERQKLSDDYRKGKAELDLRLIREAWLISPACRERLVLMQRTLDRRYDDFVDDLTQSGMAIVSAQKDLPALVLADLDLDRYPWIRRFKQTIRRLLSKQPPPPT